MPLADADLISPLLSPQSLTVSAVLALIIVGMIRGVLISKREHDAKCKECDFWQTSSAKWEQRCLDAYSVSGRAVSMTKQALTVANDAARIPDERTGDNP